MSDVVLVLSTVPDDVESADALARTLVEEKLAACVNILPAMSSIYRWRGAIERGVERQLIVKTTRANLPALNARFVELHSYELPEFIVIDIQSGSSDYLAWIAGEVLVAHP
ncbi:MAG TPA: divalent-cation tolerance protein CutA [Vicinamibacterales bacterium]|nr:divalent-cation tolerance protein CutA [Vicinamibacterales bacterium]